jgi:hypothetical protein
VRAGGVARFSFHLSPEGRGRASEASEGEGVRTPEFFSNARAPSPQPSPLWGEGAASSHPRRQVGEFLLAAQHGLQFGEFTETAVGDRVVVATDDPNSGVAVRMLPRGLPFNYSAKHIR